MFRTIRNIRANFVAGFKAGYKGEPLPLTESITKEGAVSNVKIAHSTRVAQKVGRFTRVLSEKLTDYGWTGVKVITASLLVACFITHPLATMFYLFVGTFMIKGLLMVFAMSYAFVDSILS